MNLPIALFLAFGCLFGLATFSRRHLFSEVPATPDQAAAGWSARLLWTATCSFLWPLMLVSGLHNAVLHKRRK